MFLICNVNSPQINLIANKTHGQTILRQQPQKQKQNKTVSRRIS